MSVLLATAAVWPGLAWASAGDELVLDEVLVTARKREESLQSVPISVSAIPDLVMQKLGATSVRDLQYTVPNLVFAGFWETQTSISIRGVGDFSRNMGYEMRVGVYVDGVFAGRSGSANQDLLDIERVEVLRGPQGTLFGKNTIAGAISLTTRKPDENLAGAVWAEYGNYDLVSVRALANVPLVADHLYSKFSLIYRDRDGYVDNLFPGQKDASSIDYVVARAQFMALLGDATEAMLTLDYKDDGHYTYHGDPTAGPGFDTAPQPRQLNTYLTPRNESESFASSLKVEHQFENGLTLTSLSSFRQVDTKSRWEENHGPARLFDITFSDQDEQISQELRLTSPRDQRLSYVAGLYYFNQVTSTDRVATSGSDLIPGVTLTIPQAGSVTTDSYAAFINGDFKITPQLSLAGGVRYTYEDKKITFNQLGVPFFIDFTNFRDSYSDSDVSPNIGLSYQIDSEKMIYATVSRGYKSGGWNADFVATTDIGFDSEHATNYEVGAKSQWLNNRLRVNVSAFLTEYEDFQVNQFIPVSGGGLIFSLTNAAAATSKGFEVELTAVMDQLTLTGSLGYTDATFDSFKDGGGIGVDFDGNRLALSPKYTLGISAEYRFRFGRNASGYVRGDYSYRSGVYHNPDNVRPLSYSPGYDLVDARAALQFDDSHWELAIWGKNLLDEDYENTKWITFLGTPATQFGAPRTFGVEVRWSF
jgi:iron complex outermembrane receptor protein